MTRFFEQVVLIEEPSGRTIFERRYSTGDVEYWATMTLAIRNAAGQPAGTAQVPFKIDVPEVNDFHPDTDPPEAEFQFAWVTACRESAFAHFDASMKAKARGSRSKRS